MSVMSVAEVTLAIILGVLAAIVYSLRVLVLLERRMARVDENLERMVRKVASDEKLIEDKLGIKDNPRAKKKSSTSKKSTRKKK
ncbi:MAG: hypothetical protein ACLFNK_01920 [Candidatus Woesearchaeota archaeon]